MKYTVLIFETPEDFEARTDETRASDYWGTWEAYFDALGKAGVLEGGQCLQGNETATTVRLANGKRAVQDGPYADSKDGLGGYFTLNVPDLDTALDWAAKCPATRTGAVEVRPVHPMTQA